MKINKKHSLIILILFILLILTAAAGVFAGASDMSFSDCVSALFGKGGETEVRIIRNIRLPRVLAAVTAGAGLSAAGLIMQTVLGNPMASPSTLGVSNAAVFGANLSIIGFAGGFLQTGNNAANFFSGVDPYSASLLAFIFAAGSSLGILALCRARAFSPNAVILAGIAAGAVWNAAATILQYYATDIGISAAVIWSFGDLGRATLKTDIIMLFVVTAGMILAGTLTYRLNALLGGGDEAKSLGINVGALRFFLLLAASMMTAVCVAFLGVIGFVGIICPHTAKRLVGEDHRYSLPCSALCGSLLVTLADIASRLVGGGAALPVGAVTSLIGALFLGWLVIWGKKA